MVALGVCLGAVGGVIAGRASNWLDRCKARRAAQATPPPTAATTITTDGPNHPDGLDCLAGLDDRTPQQAFQLGQEFGQLQIALSAGIPALALIDKRNTARCMTLCIRNGRIARAEKIPGRPGRRLIRVERLGAARFTEETLSLEAPW